MVDDEEYEYLSKFRWYAKQSSESLFYAVRNSDKKRMHRIILNPKSNEIIDHINGDSLDNRKLNLRIVSQKINITNGRLRKNNVSGVQGISFTKRLNKWRSYLNVGNKHYSKHFSSIEEATLYRKELEKTHLGVELPAQTLKQLKLRK